MNRKNIIYLAISVLSIALLVFIIVQISFIKQPEKKLLSASWTYNYGSIEDMTQASDFIGFIRVIKDVKNFEVQGIPQILFDTEVIIPILGADKGDNISIIMTGQKSKDQIIEIADDPLLEPDEEFLIFGKRNDDGTVTVLSGSQGRLEYKDNKLNSLQFVKSQVMNSNEHSNIKVNNENADKVIEQIKKVLDNKDHAINQ